MSEKKPATSPRSPFTTQRRASVAAWGETILLEKIRAWLDDVAPASPAGMGDDCAILPPARGPQLITVDPLIFGRHFDATLPAAVAGAKLLKRNLSDIAAMGGKPHVAVLAIAATPQLEKDWLEKFYRGLAATARAYRVKIVGGDVAQIPTGFIATLTLVGVAAGPRLLTRVGARAGDWIYVTGHLGNSFASGHHASFVPRLSEGRWLAARREIRAMMDLSDGLAKDLWSLTPTGLEPALEAACVPMAKNSSLTSALAEGEDYELCVIVDRAVERGPLERAWRKKFPQVALTRIGRMVTKGKRPVGAIDLKKYRGYEHWR